MITLEAILVEVDRFLKESRGPIALKTFRECLGNIAAQIVQLTDKAVAEKLMLALASVKKWEHLYSRNPAVRANFIIPEIEFLQDKVRQQIDFNLEGHRNPPKSLNDNRPPMTTCRR